MMPSRRSWLLGAVVGLTAGWLVAGTFRKLPSLPAGSVEEPVVADPRELYAVIRGQISAFRENNFLGAYDFAARGIREKFPVEQFREMVQRTYPRLTQRGQVNFGLAQFSPGFRASAVVYLIDGNQSSPMIYAFIKEQGKWKIEGVQMIQTSSRFINVVDPEA